MEWDTSIIKRAAAPKKRFKTKLHSFLVDILMKHDDYIDISQITSADLKTHKIELLKVTSFKRN